MKIERIYDGRYYQFSFREKNVFHVEALNDFYSILSVHELIVSGKSTNDDFKIIYEEHDSNISNNKVKIIKIPNYFDFNKDIQSGSKSILKDLISIIIENNYIDFEEIIEIKNLYDSLNLKVGVLENFINKLSLLIGKEVDLKPNGDVLEYIIANSSLEIEDYSFKYDQVNNFIIYLTILEYLAQLNGIKNYLIFCNPFYGLNSNEIEKIKNILLNISNYSIITFSTPRSFFASNFIEIKYITTKFIIDSSYIMNDIESLKLFETEKITDEVYELLSLISISLNSSVINALEHSLVGNQKDLFLAITNKIIR